VPFGMRGPRCHRHHHRCPAGPMVTASGVVRDRWRVGSFGRTRAAAPPACASSSSWCRTSARHDRGRAGPWIDGVPRLGPGLGRPRSDSPQAA
jgi:hypothetical protein